MGVPGPDISGGTTAVATGTTTDVADPTDVTEGRYDGVAAGELAATKAAQGVVSPDAIARPKKPATKYLTTIPSLFRLFVFPPFSQAK